MHRLSRSELEPELLEDHAGHNFPSDRQTIRVLRSSEGPWSASLPLSRIFMLLRSDTICSRISRAPTEPTFTMAAFVLLTQCLTHCFLNAFGTPQMGGKPATMRWRMCVDIVCRSTFRYLSTTCQQSSRTRWSRYTVNDVPKPHSSDATCSRHGMVLDCTQRPKSQDVARTRFQRNPWSSSLPKAKSPRSSWLAFQPEGDEPIPPSTQKEFTQSSSV